jgi:hypothetical protein
MVNEQAVLRAEVCYLYESLFGHAPSQNLINLYLRAHTEIPHLRAINHDQLRVVRQIIALKLDASGINFWLRRIGRDHHLLTMKLGTLVYLTECGGSYGQFTRTEKRRFILLRMTAIVLRAVLSALRGKYQILRYGLF